MKITLTDFEQRIAKALAEARYSSSRAEGLTDRRLDKGSKGADLDLEGAGSEIALSKMLNVYPDFDVGSRADEDMVTRFGERVDVKSTKYKNGHLLSVSWKKGKPADIYVLMVGEFPTYRCAGFLPAEEYLIDERLKQLVKRDGKKTAKGYFASQNELHDLDFLLDR